MRGAILVVLLTVSCGRAIGSSIRCVEITADRSFCIVEPFCLTQDVLVLPAGAKPTCRTLDDVEENYAGNCTNVFNSVMWRHRRRSLKDGRVRTHLDTERMNIESEFDLHALHPSIIIFPTYRYMHNVYHYDRALVHILDVLDMTDKVMTYRPNDLLIYEPNVTYKRQPYNSELLDTFARSERLNILSFQDSKFRCFENAVLPGPDAGAEPKFIFDNYTTPTATWRQLESNTHIPFVPRASLKFRKVIYQSLGLPIELPSEGRFIKLPAPCSVISVHLRRFRFATRSFTDQDRFLSIIDKQAEKAGFTVKKLVFEGKRFNEQAHMMKNVGIALGIHGANLANAVLMPPLGSLLEVLPTHYKMLYYAGGSNSGLHYSYVLADDPDVEKCNPFVDVGCQIRLRERPIKMSDKIWLEFEKKLKMAIVYVQTLQNLGDIPLKRVGSNYYLTKETQRAVINGWYSAGLIKERDTRQVGARECI